MGIFFSILMSIRGGFAVELGSVGHRAPQWGRMGTLVANLLWLPAPAPRSKCELPRSRLRACQQRSRTRGLPREGWQAKPRFGRR